MLRYTTTKNSSELCTKTKSVASELFTLSAAHLKFRAVLMTAVWLKTTQRLRWLLSGERTSFLYGRVVGQRIPVPLAVWANTRWRVRISISDSDIRGVTAGTGGDAEGGLDTRGRVHIHTRTSRQQDGQQPVELQRWGRDGWRVPQAEWTD